MAKKAMMCPFSGSACRDCGIYRGRHQYLCYNKEYRGYLLQNNSKKEEKAQASYVYGRDNFSFGVPEEILKSNKMIKNVEEIVVNRDFKDI